MRVLVASRDDEAAVWLERVLLSAGLSVAVLLEPAPDAPELAGVELLIADAAASAVIGRKGPTRRLLLVPRGEAVDVTAAMHGGFMDLLVVPAPEDEVLAKVGRALDQFLKPARTAEPDEGKVEEFRGIAERVTDAIKRSGPAQRASAHELAEGMLSVFMLVIDAHETSDRGTPGHSRRTGALCRELALRFDETRERSPWFELAGRLHDIGQVPLELTLDTDTPLSAELKRGLNQHPKLSVEILKPLKQWGLPVEAIRDHHERLDGSGYPRGLGGDRLTLEAQLLGAADVYEALTSPRPWRPAEAPADAIEAMRRSGGFRDEVLDALADVVASAEIRAPGPMPLPTDDR